MVEDLTSYIRQLSTIRNSTAPIHTKLPPEVLIHIFSFLSPTRRADIKFTHVCRTWRNLIHGTPQFWVDMIRAIKNPSLPEDFSDILIFLTRSASLPFVLDFGNMYNMPFLKTLEDRGHLRRLSELSMALPYNHFSLIYSFCQLSMPELRILRCRVAVFCFDDTSGPREEEYDFPIVHNFPRLRRLELPEGLLFTPFLAVPSLTTLVHSGEPLDPILFILALKLCPELEVLSLQNFRRPTGLSFDVENDDLRCPLPRMSWCSIDNSEVESSRSFVREFLHMITLPPTACLTVYHADVYFPSDIIPPLFQPAIVGTINKLHLTIESGDTTDIRRVGIACSAGDFKCIDVSLTTRTCEWSRRDVDCYSILHDATEIFSSARITSLVLECAPDDSEKENIWINILLELPFLLSLIVHVRSCRKLLRALGPPGHIICAFLRCLAITSCSGSGVHELLVMVAEWRVSMGAPLEKLEYYDESSPPLSVSRMQRLRAVVPEVIVSDRRPD